MPPESSATKGEVEAAMRRSKRKRKEHVEQCPHHSSKPLPVVLFHQTPTQSPAPETPVLAMRTTERGERMRQQVAAPAPPQNFTLEQEEEALAAVMARSTKERKSRKQMSSSSPYPPAAAGTPFLEQEAKVTKKRKRRKEQDESGQQPLPFDGYLAHCTQLQGTTAPPGQRKEQADAPKGNSIRKSNGKKPRGLSNRDLIKMRVAELRKRPTLLPEGFVAAMSVESSPNYTEQNPNHSSPFGAFFDQFAYKPTRQTRNPPPPRATSAETPILEQEVKMTKKRKRMKEKELPGQSPLPFGTGQTHCGQQGMTFPREPKQEQDDAPKGNSMKKSNGKNPRVLSDREIIKMRVVELRKQQKLPAGFVAPTSVAPSPNCTEQGPNHSLPFSAFFDQFAYKPVESSPNYTEQNPNHSSPFGAFFDQFAYKPTRQTRNPPPPRATSAETPILEQEAKMTKKRKRMKEKELPGQSPLPFGTGQTHCGQQGMTFPREPKQEQDDAPKGNSMKKSNGKNPHVLSDREIIKMRVVELRKQQKLPAGFVAPTSVAPSPNCTEQGPNHSLPFSAFFDQFAYKPVESSPNYTEQNPNHSSPFGAFFDQFAYKPTRQTRNPPPPRATSAETPILEQEAKMTKKRKRMKEKELPGQSPLPFGTGQTHCGQQGMTFPREPKQEQDDAPMGNSMKKSNGKNPRVLSDREIIKMRVVELRKQQKLPAGFVAPTSVAPSPNCTEQGPNHSLPFSAFFDQFAYKPVRQDRNPLLSRTPDPLARLPPRGYPSFESSQFTANEISKASKDNTSVASKTKVKGSGSASGSHEKVNAKVKENTEKKTRTKKQREPPPLLSSAEKRSDKYHRLPLDQLVPPPRSPHKLLQEKYASDPWKVIVICMLLNLTQGKQVRTKVKGFFKRYPDAQSASYADPEMMAGYLQPLGLHRVKTYRIQKFSKEYVEKEWTYITELCGVGKYAADAYAIFCAGRATEVVPIDHKLVDYWKYVCYQLPMIQGLQNVQEVGVTELSNVSPRVQESVMCC